MLTNTGQGEISVGVGTTGDFSETNDCGTSLAYGASCSINVAFSPTASGTRVGSVTVTSNAGTYSSSLSGTGVVPVDAAISVHFGSTHLAYPGVTTVTVCITPAGKLAATGTVQIYDGTTLLATRPVAGCALWIIAPGLSVGTHQLTVVYSGDRNNPGGVSAPATIVVDPAPVILVPLCGSPILEYGGNYQCIVGALSLAGAARGSITYSYDNGAPVSVNLSHGAAEFSIASPAVGSHTVSISYAQQGNFAAATAPIQRFTVRPAPARGTHTAGRE
jgi:hypothetical protein